MSNINPHKLMVNGPVNVIRLEGSIDSIPKVIYLFMDYHIKVNFQTQCSNIFSEDVQKYFTRSFFELNKETNDKFDFFIEIYPSELSRVRKTHYEQKEKYIEEVVKFFRKIFKFDPKKNKVSVNKLFKNIRLHYLDVRDYYELSASYQVDIINKLVKKFTRTNNVNVRDLETIIDQLDLISDHLDLIIKTLEAPVSSVSSISTSPNIIKYKHTYTFEQSPITYLSNKIKASYAHNHVKKILNSLLKDSIQNFISITDLIDTIKKKLISYIKLLSESEGKLTLDKNTTYLYTYGLSSYTMRNMITDIANSIEQLIVEKFVEYFARFTDIYFLRRFLDKDYITNAITYTGGMHSNTYVHILVNLFDFKITHISHSKLANMSKLNDEIRKGSAMEIQRLLLPEELNQCSDLTHFPKNFS